LNLGWPYDLLWLIESNRNDLMWVIRPSSPERPWSLLLCSLRILSTAGKEVQADPPEDEKLQRGELRHPGQWSSHRWGHIGSPSPQSSFQVTEATWVNPEKTNRRTLSKTQSTLAKFRKISSGCFKSLSFGVV
jgi:hypothetical protein